MTQIAGAGTIWLVIAQGLIGLVAAQPLAYIPVLTWGRLLVMVLVVFGLGYLMWRERPAAQAAAAPTAPADAPGDRSADGSADTAGKGSADAMADGAADATAEGAADAGTEGSAGGPTDGTAASASVSVSASAVVGSPRRPPAGTLPVVLALAMVYALNQFRPGGLGIGVHSPWAVWPAWLPVAVIAASLAALGICAPRALRWRRLDWAAAAAAVAMAGMAIGPALLGGRDGAAEHPWPWLSLLQVGESLLVWLAATRLVEAAPRRGWHVALWAWAVLVVTVTAGLVQGGASLYWAGRGDHARRAGDRQLAASYYERARHLAGRMGLYGVADGAAFSLAALMVDEGHPEAAAAALGLQPNFEMVIPADEWDGPEGGELFYHVSCWKDLVLYPGEIEISLFARGDHAQGVWPLMRVKLDNRILDDVFVDSQQPKEFRFTVREPAARRARLEVEFMNDFKLLGSPVDRNLWVLDAHIRYREVAWE